MSYFESPFVGDYVEFKDGEMVTVRCMRCGVTVAKMEEYPSEKYKDRKYSRRNRKNRM